MSRRLLNSSVTAVMVTGKSLERVSFAKAAIESFKLQTYTNKNLLIINDSHIPLLKEPEAGVVEHMVYNDDKKLTLGDLRNLAFDLSTSDYLVQWDDDDWYHPERIAVQVAGIENRGSAVFLKNQIRYSFLSDTAYVYKSGPIHGTVLHPRKIRQRYPSLKRAEDTVFMKLLPSKVIIDNDPALYLRFSHGFNTWDEAHIMQKAAEEDMHGLRLGFEDFRVETSLYLDKVLKEHYAWRPAHVQQDIMPSV